MKLVEALNQVERLFDSQVIFARKPWTLDSEALIGQLDEKFRVPAEVTERDLEYFLDVPVVKEVLSVFGARKPTPKERVELLLYYAENDAYPEWVYKP